MLCFTPGASGSGKSTIIPLMRQRLPEAAVYDFDTHPIQNDIGIMQTAAQRQQVAEAWLQTALTNGAPLTIVCGLGVMGEVLACPSAPLLNHIAFCLLDCDDVARLDRIRGRGDAHLADMDMLCWAAWLRVHHTDPQFRQDVIRTGDNPAMRWERWAGWRRGHPHWRCHPLDTTLLTPDAVADAVTDWVRAEQGLVAGGYRLVLEG